MINLDIADLVESIKKNTKEKDQPERILMICQINLLMTMTQILGEIRDSLKTIEKDMMVR